MKDGMKKWGTFGTAALAALLLALFLPVFTSVIWYGNNLDYNAEHKIYPIYGNRVLLALVMLGILVFFCLLYCLKK